MATNDREPLGEALLPRSPQGIDEDDADEALDEAARGANATSDDADDSTGEIDTMGQAAGITDRGGRAFRGIDEVEHRDQSRWELDPQSAEDDPAAR